MIGVEIDMIVADSLKALKTYQAVFGAEPVEVTSYPKGLNEAVFQMYGSRFHLLDENPEYQMTAPRPGDPKPMWINIVVPDIHAPYEKAMNEGFTAVQPLTEMPEMGVSNAIVADPYGYLWMLHQIHREVSFDERCRMMEESMGIQPEARHD